MNVELLRKVQSAILANPEAFDMNFFEHANECRTTYCIGGWAEKLSGQDKEPGEILGLTEDQAERLFYVEGSSTGDELEGWPKQFKGSPDIWLPTPQQAVDRIDWFIATEGRE